MHCDNSSNDTASSKLAITWLLKNVSRPMLLHYLVKYYRQLLNPNISKGNILTVWLTCIFTVESTSGKNFVLN